MPLLRRVFIHIAALSLMYQGLRLGFYLANQTQFLTAPSREILNSFLHGVRFDLATIALTNSFFYLLYLLPLPTKLKRPTDTFVIWAATCVNFFCIGLNLADFEYYKFTGKRMTIDALAVTQDISQQIGQLASYYWYLSLLLILAFLLNYRLHRWVFSPPASAASKKRPWFDGLLTALCILGLGLAIRGGWQAKPLIPAHAFTAASPSLGVLTLNSAFSFFKSSAKDGLEELNFLSPQELARELAPAAEPDPRSLPRAPRNIVVIILESFGKEYILPPDGRPSFTPFLKQLMEKGSSFPLSFANGRRSIDVVPSLFAGIPAWMNPPFITSPYQTNQLRGLPEILVKHGFQTSFYHGGHNGTMFFDVLAKSLGFQDYIGANEYPYPEHSDGQWGIFDEPFLQFVIEDLNQKKAPFFASIFTLTSHNPYKIPESFHGRFPKGSLEIHESLGYADYALQEFFQKARQQSWYPDTLFVLTADHTSKSESPYYENIYGRFAVPLIFLQNDRALPFPELGRVTQHIDLMPTLLDLLRIPMPPLPPFANSLWRTNHRPGIVLYDANMFALLGQDKLISSNLHDNAVHFRWREDPLLTKAIPLSSEQDQDLRFLKAQVQFYHQGMIQNKLILRPQPSSEP